MRKHPVQSWLPEPWEYNEGKKRKKLISGQPTFSKLISYENDRALKGHEIVGCCDCGMVHLVTYEVFKGKSGFWLVSRGFPIEDASMENRRKMKPEFVKKKRP